jgi:ABC-type lipoprotein export system ATPase subunit
LPKYRDIAMVFQSYALCPHMTVFANIAYPLTVRGQPKAQVEAAVKDVDGGAINGQGGQVFRPPGRRPDRRRFC